MFGSCLGSGHTHTASGLALMLVMVLRKRENFLSRDLCTRFSVGSLFVYIHTWRKGMRGGCLCSVPTLSMRMICCLGLEGESIVIKLDIYQYHV